MIEKIKPAIMLITGPLSELKMVEIIKKASPPEKNYTDLTKLIKSIQRAEKNPDCFRNAQEYCDRLDCAWRKYCLEDLDYQNGF